MSSMSVTSSTSRILARPAPAQSAPAVTAVPAKFVDMYRGAITDAIDTDGDGKVSKEEYERQLLQAGSSAENAENKWASLDKDGDGQIDKDDFAKTIADPLGNERDAVLRQIVKELASGRGTQTSRQVLDANGKVADPHAMLRHLADMFPGNMQY